MNAKRSIFKRARMTIALAFLGLALTPPLRADNPRIVELIDGSQIMGEIVLFEHGVYTVESVSLGRLRILDSDIRTIRAAGQMPPRQAHSPTTNAAPSDVHGLRQYQSQIVGDPEILSMVMTLQHDPGVLAVLNDPSVMQAIAAGDFNALQNNAKILELENNPTIRQILNLVGRQ